MFFEKAVSGFECVRGRTVSARVVEDDTPLRMRAVGRYAVQHRARGGRVVVLTARAEAALSYLPAMSMNGLPPAYASRSACVRPAAFIASTRAAPQYHGSFQFVPSQSMPQSLVTIAFTRGSRQPA